MRPILLLVVIASSLPAPAQTEGEGAPLAPSAATLEDRAQPRIRAAVSLVGAVALSFPYMNLQGAPGLSAELGVLFSDKLSIIARATLATVLVLTVSHLGVSVDRVLSDHVSLGVGLAYTWAGGFFVDSLPGTAGISLPVRISWMFSERSPEQRGRRGVYVFGEATPGVVLSASRGGGLPPRPDAGPPLLIAASVGLGYGWW